MTLPSTLKYTREHEWISVDGTTATVGITDYAQSELGEIVFVEVDTLGQTLSAGDVFGTVEAVKTVSDLYLPVDATILEFNTALEETPELLNDHPFDQGWVVKVEIKDPAQLDALLSASEYTALIGA